MHARRSSTTSAFAPSRTRATRRCGASPSTATPVSTTGTSCPAVPSLHISRAWPFAIEQGGAEQLNERVQRWLSRTRDIAKPVVPSVRGKITIADVTGAAAEEYAGAVRRWADSVWDAWREHHDLAREWIAAAGLR